MSFQVFQDIFVENLCMTNDDAYNKSLLVPRIVKLK